MDNVTPDIAVLQLAIDRACRAPSLHNSQPWRWHYEDGVVQLFGDRRRLLRAADPSGRQLSISCGAALDHFRIALTALGWHSDIRMESRSEVPSMIATVSFRHDARPQSHDFDLLKAISRRRTDRRSFAHFAGVDDLAAKCASLAKAAGVGLVALGPDARAEIGAAAEVTTAARTYDAEYHAELRWWAGHNMRRGGIPETALVSDEAGSVPYGRGFPARLRAGAPAGSEMDASTILVLGTPTDTRVDWLRCGQALSTVLLESTLAGAATCPLSHLTEIAVSRAMLQRLTPGVGVPQILLRVGEASDSPPPAMTPRRPLDEVFTRN